MATSAFPAWIASRLSPVYKEQQEAILEEQRKIREKADRYDSLVNNAGFQDFLNVMLAKIAAEISEATKKPMLPEEQRLHVIRWDAMRSLLDEAQNDIMATRKERDRLKDDEAEYLRLKTMQEQGEEVNA